MGEYGYVTIGEFLSDELAMTFATDLRSQENVRTTTLRASPPHLMAWMHDDGYVHPFVGRGW